MVNFSLTSWHATKADRCWYAQIAFLLQGLQNGPCLAEFLFPIATRLCMATTCFRPINVVLSTSYAPSVLQCALQAAAEAERAALAARLEELDEVSAGAVAAAEADAKKALDEAAAKVEKNNERANEVRAVILPASAVHLMCEDT